MHIMLSTALLILLMIPFATSQCVPGQYDINETCEFCPPNTYSTANDSLQCDQCINCQDCISTNGDCSLCQPGFQPSGQNCQKCPTHMHSPGNIQCQDCNASCLECSAQTGACTVCGYALVLTNGSCVPCSDGQYYEPENSTCQPCSYLCLTCNFTGDSNCLSCKQNYALSDLTCSPCPNGTFSQNSQACQPCSTANCSKCTNSTCLSCLPGLTLLNDNQCGYPCSEIIQQCALCSSGNQCLNCSKSNMIVFFNSCVPSNCLIFNCLQCLNFVMCKYCQSGYIPSADLSSCLMCTLANCQLCLANGTCANCMGEYMPVLGNCQLCGVTNCNQCDNSTGVITCTSCQNGYFLDSNKCPQCLVSQCQNCSSGVLCYECQEGFGLAEENKTCLPCQSPNCTQCEVSTVCLLCQEEYLPIDGICYYCGTPHCTQCQAIDNTTLICLECLEQGYYLNQTNNSCSPCPQQNCLICSQDQCQQCSQDYNLLNNGSECVYCNLHLCRSCSADNYCSQCTQSDYRPVEGSCILCGVPYCTTCSPDDLSCIQCQDGFTLDSTSNICQCSIENCLNCSAGQCQQCNSNYIVFGNECILRCSIDNCIECVQDKLGLCQVCNTSYQLSTDQQNCLACNISNCISCQGPNYCSICYNNIISIQGLCPLCLVPNCMTCQSNNSCQVCYKGYKQHAVGNPPVYLCVLCPPQCADCLSNGTCIGCRYPFNFPLQFYEPCYLCLQPNCNICNQLNSSICIDCFSGFYLFNSSCLPCGIGCSHCSSQGCNNCQLPYQLINNSCQLCPRAPICYCNFNTPQTCVYCTPGYQTVNGSCVPIQPYCSKGNQTYCEQLFYSLGVVLVSLTQGSNILVACDPNCLTCSPSNPLICISCRPGYYINPQESCSPCTYSSRCFLCLQSNPNVCITCFAGSVLTIDNICTQPSTPPIASVPNCLNQLSQNSGLVCIFCQTGFTLVQGSCVPCIIGCLICNPATLNFCTICMPGWKQNEQYQCIQTSQCSKGCMKCLDQGCSECQQNMFLNRQFECQLPCQYPCASCDVQNLSQCTSCVDGFTLSGGQCTPSNCSDIGNCLTCPFGSALKINNTNFTINQICVSCDQLSQCARCSLTNLSQCTACSSRYYLTQTNDCQQCPESCSQCLGPYLCLKCADGYFSLAFSTLWNSAYPNFYNTILNCLSCRTPCATCENQPTSCTSCMSSDYTLTGNICLTNFNFVIEVVFAVTLDIFEQNYLGFMTKIASGAGVSINDIVVQSIASGSVQIKIVVSSPNPSGSQGAVNAQNNLNNLIKSGQSINNMPISSSTLTTQGTQSGSYSDNVLSRTDIILIAVLIPAFVIVVAIVTICLCLKRRKKRQNQESIEGQSATPNEEVIVKQLQLAIENDIELRSIPIKKTFL